MKLSGKLVLYFLLVGLLPFIVIAVISLNNSSQSIKELSFDKLEAIKTIKKNQISSYIENKTTEVEVISETQDVLNSIEGFIQYHNEMEIGSTESYDRSSSNINVTESYEELYAEAHNALKKYAEKYGYYDLFLICAKHGHVMYTYAKEDDLGTNLSSGEFKNSNLATLWSQAKNDSDVHITDIEPYAPSNDAPAMFLGKSIKNSENEIIGVFALQIPLDQINVIMQERTGMGKTGETYLVGEDLLMRSDSFLDPINRTVEKSLVGTVNRNGVDTIAVVIN